MESWTWMRKLLLLAAIILLVSSLPARADTGPCYDALQGKIALDYSGNTSWASDSMDRLCGDAHYTEAPTQCFNKVMHGGVDWGGGTQWQWQNAIDLCERTTNAEATVACFQSEVGSGVAWDQAIAECDERSAVAASNTAAPVTPAGDGWTKCADENGVCTFAGTRKVRYGANGAYATGEFTDSVGCNNTVFGDPVPNVVKQCEFGPEVAAVALPATTVTPPTTAAPPAVMPPAAAAVEGKTTTPVMDTTTAQILGASTEPDICWKDSYGRGVGEVPSACPDGWERTGADLLCYPKCSSGFYGVGPVCWQDCPADFRNDGAFCAKPGPYGRGAGYPWKFGDSLDDSSMFERCERDHGRGNCEKNGLIVYPRCKPSFHNEGCCVCSPNCPQGMTDIGVSCAKQSYGRGVGQGGLCPTGQEQDFQGGLCYPKCQGSSSGVGPVCWSSCPTDFPVNCGAACGVNEAACAFAIMEQVQSSSEVALNVVALVTTAGAGNAGIKAARTAGKAAQKNLTRTARDQLKRQAKDQAQNALKWYRRNQKVTKVQGWLEKGSNMESYSEMMVDAYEKGEFDFTQLAPSVADVEPTGVLAVVNAFNKPICGR
jgi:hypothetical protein